MGLRLILGVEPVPDNDNCETEALTKLVLVPLEKVGLERIAAYTV